MTGLEPGSRSESANEYNQTGPFVRGRLCLPSTLRFAINGDGADVCLVVFAVSRTEPRTQSLASCSFSCHSKEEPRTSGSEVRGSRYGALPLKRSAQPGLRLRRELRLHAAKRNRVSDCPVVLEQESVGGIYNIEVEGRLCHSVWDRGLAPAV